MEGEPVEGSSKEWSIYASMVRGADRVKPMDRVVVSDRRARTRARTGQGQQQQQQQWSWRCPWQRRGPGSGARARPAARRPGRRRRGRAPRAPPASCDRVPTPPPARASRLARPSRWPATSILSPCSRPRSTVRRLFKAPLIPTAIYSNLYCIISSGFSKFDNLLRTNRFVIFPGACWASIAAPRPTFDENPRSEGST